MDRAVAAVLGLGMTRTIDVDYLVVGAGAMGMAFTDALIDHSDTRVALVDRRHSAGGHWLEAYPFVRLHQASAFYGVASTLLGGGRLQECVAFLSINPITTGHALVVPRLEVAHWMGLRVPDDVSVAGLDDLPGSDAAGLTTALVPYRSLGERAGDALMALLGGEEPATAPDLPTALAIRRTTGPPPPGLPGS